MEDVKISMSRKFYMPKRETKTMIHTLIFVYGYPAKEAEEVVSACGTDLRQINIMLGLKAVCSGKDSAPSSLL